MIGISLDDQTQVDSNQQVNLNMLASTSVN